jgi:hypothetical protein
VNIRKPADVVSVINGLAQELGILHERIVNRTIESEAAEGVLSRCSNEYLKLVKFSRDLQLKQGSTEGEKEFQRQLDAVNTNLQVARETLGQLIEVLDIRANLSGSRRLPRDFQKRHSLVETAIQETLLTIDVLLEENGGPAGSQEPSHGGPGSPGPTSDIDDKRQYRKMHHDWSNFG